MASKSKGSLLERLVPILLLASIVLAFVVGVLWNKVSQLEGSGAKVAGTTKTDTGGDSGNTAPQGPIEGKLTSDQVSKIPEVTDKDHIRGNSNAEITLIEYSDYECPFCSRFHPTVQQVMKEYGDKVRWVYRHFPLEQIHTKARPAAEASECVADLGGEDAFWAFTDKIFEDQTRLSDLASVAQSIGVNKTQFQNCVDGSKFKDLVNEFYQGGITLGITGTPGNLIMNKKGEAWLIPGALPFESIKATIDEALQS